MPLQSVYEQPAQQAQFFSMAASVCLAFIVVWLNQWSTNRRSRRDFTLNKLEDLYKAILEFEDCFIIFCSPTADFEDRNVIIKPQDKLIKCEMYKKLYFSQMKMDRITLNQALTNIYLKTRREELSGTERLNILNENKKIIQDFIDEAKEYCEKLVSSYKH